MVSSNIEDKDLTAGQPSTLREYRLSLGMTLEKASSLIGADPSWLSRLERGHADRFYENIERVKKISEMYGLSLDELESMVNKKEDKS